MDRVSLPMQVERKNNNLFHFFLYRPVQVSGRNSYLQYIYTVKVVEKPVRVLLNRPQALDGRGNVTVSRGKTGYQEGYGPNTRFLKFY